MNGNGPEGNEEDESNDIKPIVQSVQLLSQVIQLHLELINSFIFFVEMSLQSLHRLELYQALLVYFVQKQIP